MSTVLIQDSTLTSIGNAIRTKNGAVTTYLPSEMPTAIQNIPSGGTVTPQISSLYLLFGKYNSNEVGNLKNLQNIDNIVPLIDWSQVDNVSRCFQRADLQNIDLSFLNNLQNMVDASYFFSSSTNINFNDLSDGFWSHISTAKLMFNNCTAVTSITAEFDTSLVPMINFSNAFTGTSGNALTSIKFGKTGCSYNNTGGAVANPFAGSGLTRIELPGNSVLQASWSSSSALPSSCYIYVPSDLVNAYKSSSSGWSSFSSRIRSL